MTKAGWAFMLVSCLGVLSLTAFCFYRVLRTPRATEHMHAPLDIDTHDQEEE